MIYNFHYMILLNAHYSLYQSLIGSFRFDDCTVTPIATEFVLKKQPYLLYYRRTSPNPLLGGVPRSVTPSKSPSPKTPSPKPLLEPSRIIIGPKRPSPTPPKSPFGEKRRSLDGGKHFFSSPSNGSTPTKTPTKPLQKWKPFSSSKR